MEERRDQWIMELLEKLERKIDSLLISQTEISTKLKDHIESEDKIFDQFSEDLKSGFPDGDMVKHRLYHEAEIEKSRRTKEQATIFVKDLLVKGMWASAVFILYTIWDLVIRG